MGNMGLLIDYEFCTGCRTCEVACKEEHDIPVGQWGIRVNVDGPWEISEHEFNFNFLPYPTDLCDGCADRVAAGREPTCVHHCLANVMQYGPVSELAAKLEEKTKQVLYVPQYRPKQAKGPFEPKNKFDPNRHRFGAVEVSENTHFTNSAQRADSRNNAGLEENLDLK